MEGKSAENESARLGGEEAVEEDDEMLKKRISGHPLYGLLIEAHLNCLKVALGDDIGEVGITTALNQANMKLNVPIPRCSDLDKFMEAYCMELGKLKEAMEKPLQETAAYIDDVHARLSELTVIPQPLSPPQ